MSREIEICFAAKSGAPAPVLPHELTAFRQDNPHLNSDILPQGVPFILRSQPAPDDRPWRERHPDLALVFNQIQSLSVQSRRNIANLNQMYGSDMLLALSVLHEKEIAPLLAQGQRYGSDTLVPVMRKESNGMAGAAATAMESRLSNFAKAAGKYQRALENVRRAHLAKVPKAEMVRLESIANTLHRELNVTFRVELDRYMGVAKARSRGTAWSSSQRGINVAKGARSYEPIRLTSTKEFYLIRNFERVASVAGKGAIMIDAGMRANNVYGDYKAGENWQRSAVAETTGFGFGTAAGASVGAAVINVGLGITMLATPVGWVLIIGTAVALGYGASKAGDAIGKAAALNVYDYSAGINW